MTTDSQSSQEDEPGSNATGTTMKTDSQSSQEDSAAAAANNNNSTTVPQNGIVDQEMNKIKEEENDSGITSNTSSNGEAFFAPAEGGESRTNEDDDEDNTAGKNASVALAEENGDKTDNTQSQPEYPQQHASNNSNSKAPEEKDDQFKMWYLRWYNPIRNFSGRIVNDERFQILIVLLIVLNAIMMGLATYDFVDKNPKVQEAFEIVDLVFLIIFTVESALQLAYHGYQLFYDGWLTFDLLVVVMSWTLTGVQVFRAIRVFRAFRLMARLKVLKELVNAIVAVLPRIGSIMMLFALVLYIYATLCTVLFGDSRYGEDNVDYFGRLDYSLFTLFQFVTLDNWGSTSRSVMAIHPAAGPIFLSFLMISSFILYSLVVAVVCDAVAVVEHPDIALKLFEQNMAKEKKMTGRKVRMLEANLDDLSQQQMEVLSRVQNSLMKLDCFQKDATASRNETRVN